MRYRQFILALILPLSAFGAESAVEPTTVTVRAVANGAKIIGSNVGGARITITDAETGEVLASGVQEGGTGDTALIMNATPKSAGPIYDTPGAAGFETALAISEPRLLEVIAEGPLDPPHATRRASKTVLVFPGRHITGDGIIIKLAGYRVALDQPGTGEALAAGSNVDVTATVTMACGCPLEPGGLWDSDPIEISARVIADNGAMREVPLAFAGEASTFAGEIEVPGAGPFELQIIAINPTTGDSGLATARFVAESSN